MPENEMVGWHQQLYGHEFEQVPGVGDGQGSLVCCIPWGHIFKYILKFLFPNIMQGRKSELYLGMSVKYHLLIHLFTQSKYLNHTTVPLDRG